MNLNLKSVIPSLLLCSLALWSGCKAASNPPGLIDLDCDTTCQAAWLAEHNELRQALNAGDLPNSPTPATPLSDLVRDEDLAQVAQEHADACNNEYDADRTDDYQALSGSTDSVAQNLVSHTTLSDEETCSFEDYFAPWSAEEADYEYGTFNPVEIDSRNYTQLIWANATRAGCGIQICDNGGGSFLHFAVCNYAPTGNLIGQYPYTEE